MDIDGIILGYLTFCWALTGICGLLTVILAVAHVSTAAKRPPFPWDSFLALLILAGGGVAGVLTVT